MILDISDNEFKKIFSNEKLYLPIRWDNRDFILTLKELFDEYLITIQNNCSIEELYKDLTIDVYRIKRVCRYIINVIEEYLNGFPSKAFKKFCSLMELLEKTPLKTFDKSITEHFSYLKRFDPFSLYRITSVTEDISYDRSRVFHVPYYLRSKVSTTRYSIAGFPSLYLGTSLELCYEEVHHNPHEQLALASRFELERNFELNNIEIKVIELAIKPQDFFEEKENHEYFRTTRIISRDVLEQSDIREAYLLWYPLIAACSFIRANKKDPFAVEYIIPQLLMQWVRLEMEDSNLDYNQLIGIRYFSCASMKASDMGFNYVFPASGKQNINSYCPVLARAFKLTKPYFLHEYDNIYSWERALRKDMDLDFI